MLHNYRAINKITNEVYNVRAINYFERKIAISLKKEFQQEILDAGYEPRCVDYANEDQWISFDEVRIDCQSPFSDSEGHAIFENDLLEFEKEPHNHYDGNPWRVFLKNGMFNIISHDQCRITELFWQTQFHFKVIPPKRKISGEKRHWQND